MTPAIFCVCSCLNFAENVFFSRNTPSICTATKSAAVCAAFGTSGAATADADGAGGEGSVVTVGFVGSFFAVFVEAVGVGFFLSDVVADGGGSGAADADGLADTSGAGSAAAEGAELGAAVALGCAALASGCFVTSGEGGAGGSSLHPAATTSGKSRNNRYNGSEDVLPRWPGRICSRIEQQRGIGVKGYRHLLTGFQTEGCSSPRRPFRQGTGKSSCGHTGRSLIVTYHNTRDPNNLHNDLEDFDAGQ